MWASTVLSYSLLDPCIVTFTSRQRYFSMKAFVHSFTKVCLFSHIFYVHSLRRLASLVQRLVPHPDLVAVVHHHLPRVQVLDLVQIAALQIQKVPVAPMEPIQIIIRNLPRRKVVPHPGILHPSLCQSRRLNQSRKKRNPLLNLPRSQAMYLQPRCLLSILPILRMRWIGVNLQNPKLRLQLHQEPKPLLLF